MKNQKNERLEFIAINGMGWHRADSPAQAIAGLDLLYNTRPEEAEWDYEPEDWRSQDGDKHTALCEECDKKEDEARRRIALWVAPKELEWSINNYQVVGGTLIYNDYNIDGAKPENDNLLIASNKEPDSE